MRGILIFLAFISAILFPWQITAVLVVASSFFIPLLPFAVGIFVDTLYYTPRVALIPWFTLLGVVVTLVAILVRSRLQASTIQK
jgi:hypothetical protein